MLRQRYYGTKVGICTAMIGSKTYNNAYKRYFRCWEEIGIGFILSWANDNYMHQTFPGDELSPLSCKGNNKDVWGCYCL